ncbi:hypothetical protein [Desulfohalovibrio reitneri]|uniref:hypothetical protein n=1 Tax=Desulfohalovibrio reitneri TaxID=1307759 RepID=UPI001F31E202|nr:hypothetical protein [Desulfohalovibrio reitneri]
MGRKPGANESPRSSGGNRMPLFVLVRDLLIFIVGTWYFEFHLDFRLPGENNLLLFFVAIPIIWATMMQMWTSISYREQKNAPMYWACHLLAVVLLASSVFLISAVLNTIETSLDATGNILFHGVGWSAVLGIIYYDVVDISR